MNIEILVRNGFGRTIRNLQDLSHEEIDRLTSRSGGPEQNLAVEFDIEKAIREYGEALGISFNERGEPDPNTKTYDLRRRGLLWEEESEMIRALRLPLPKTLLLSAAEHLPLPIIIKNPESRRGREVYLVTEEVGFQNALKFLRSSTAVVPSLGGEVSYDSSFEREKLLQQEYIETPSDRFTTYRVTISCTGEIFSECMTYSGNKKIDDEVVVTTPSPEWHKKDLLTLPDSPFFLHAKKVVSNKSAGGGGIVLDPNENSKKSTGVEQAILAAHGLDPIQPILPEFIQNESKKIAAYLNDRGVGLIYGIDWIQSREGKFFYLETNISPAAMPYIYTHANGDGTHADGMIRMMREILNGIMQR